MSTPAVFNSQEDLNRVIRGIREIERIITAPTRPGFPAMHGPGVVNVRVTSSTASSGQYPAVFCYRVTESNSVEWIESDETCWVEDLNDGALVQDQRYIGHVAGVLNYGGSTKTGKALVIAVKPSASSTVSSWKEPVRVATVQNGTFNTGFENGDTVDGVVLVTGDRILLKNQSTASQNGIYTVNASGPPTRATDADTGSELIGATVWVSEGTSNADTIWTCTNNATITLGSTSLNWVQIFPHVLLCEVTISSGSGAGNHTVKQKSVNTGTGAITDHSPSTTFANCRSATGTLIPVGTRVWLVRIATLTGEHWIFPAQHATSGKPGTVSEVAQVYSGEKEWENTGYFDIDLHVINDLYVGPAGGKIYLGDQTSLFGVVNGELIVNGGVTVGYGPSGWNALEPPSIDCASTIRATQQFEAWQSATTVGIYGPGQTFASGQAFVQGQFDQGGAVGVIYGAIHLLYESLVGAGSQFWATHTLGGTGARFSAVKYGVNPAGTQLWGVSGTGGGGDTFDGGICTALGSGTVGDGVGISISGLTASLINQGSYSSLTDSTGGTSGATLSAVGDTSASDQSSVINDNFASINAAIEQLKGLIAASGLIS